MSDGKGAGMVCPDRFPAWRCDTWTLRDFSSPGPYVVGSDLGKPSRLRVGDLSHFVLKQVSEMPVYVFDLEGQPLMPTTRGGRVRYPLNYRLAKTPGKFHPW